MKPLLLSSRTVQGAITAGLSEIVRLWSIILAWSDLTVHAILGTITIVGFVWGVIGARGVMEPKPEEDRPRRTTSVLLVLGVLLAMGGCSMPCQQRTAYWSQVNTAAVVAMRAYALPHMGEQGETWLGLTELALETARAEYLIRCLAANPEHPPAPPP